MRIRYFMAVGALAISASATAEITQLIDLKGPELFAAAEKAIEWKRNTLTPEDVLTLTEKLATELSDLPKEGSADYALTLSFRDACKTAEGAAVDRLTRVYASFDPGDSRRQTLLPDLAGAWLHRELAEMRLAPGALKMPNEQEIPLPDTLRDAPEELSNAWREYETRRALFRAFQQHERKTDGISFQKNQRTFFHLVDAVLLREASEASEQLARFDWDSWCGTGSDTFVEPAGIALFLALLHERKLELAVSAALALKSENLLLFGEEKRNQRIEFLQKCGLDWEALLTGAEVEVELHTVSPNSVFPRELAQYGGERAARFLLQLTSRAAPSSREIYLRSLGAFLTRSAMTELDQESEGYVSVNTLDFERVARTKISEETRTAILTQLMQFADVTAPRDLAAVLVQMLAKAHDAQTIPALKILLLHPASQIQAAAAEALQSLGETIPPVIAKGPVRVHVLLNGKSPGPEVRLSWSIEFGAGGSLSSTGKNVDIDGFIEIDRNEFLDPKRIPQSFAISSSAVYETNSATPWFVVSLPPPADLDAVIEARVETLPMSLVLQSPPGRALSGPATIILRRRDRHHSEGFSTYDSRTFVSPASGPIALPLMSPGACQAEIKISGATTVRSEFEARKGAAPLTVQLERGSDVQVRVLLPDGKPFDGILELSSNGQRVDPTPGHVDGIYRGLPIGNYAIHIPSSSELAAENYRKMSPGPDEIGSRTRDIAFTISENSPAVIVLGEIRLEQAED